MVQVNQSGDSIHINRTCMHGATEVENGSLQDTGKH